MNRMNKAETNTAYSDYEYFGGPEGIDAYDHYEATVVIPGEIAAENAWLIAAESGVDDGFEQWEMDRGCYMDPQSGYAFPI